ncbi:glycoside hydrolase family 35 protein [Streptococcus merionis]|uniref:Beta-galactosidase 3 n=1 Tax=Streptococcus merionis TaxID=400065 RepID=A0A239SZV0_9STRE|nr:beta-galactosidase family protein [Streptococcus merionis]SNU91011.1 beta-galactosidase 3 [Streptococcus merionis]
MTRFEISDEFYLDGHPFKILSGAIHYFRVHPDDWYHSLYNLKALGFNTVETYVAWNLHEPRKGQFDFEGILDIERFLDTAKDLGLYAIVRPSPFICAEWEFGGLPAWLLTEKMRIRSSDPCYLKHVADYYDILLPKLVKRQLDRGGNILMVQIENEYGSFGEEKEYLKALKALMKERGVSVPFFTSDGPWRATLRAGSLIEEGIFATGNFGSKAAQNFQEMQAFFDEHGKRWPLMCMEFWDGWFNRWKEPIIRRNPEELAQAVHECISLGSINLYMFHGGTNFGFMNGCSARGVTDLPQVTSYDYDALLDEQGNPTAKYFAIKSMLHTFYPDLEQQEPLIKETLSKEGIPLKDRVSLFATLDSLAEPIETVYPLTMEALGQSTGYLLYRTQVENDRSEPERFRIIDGRDRAQFFINEKLVTTQYQAEIGEDIFYQLEDRLSQVDVLIENMGRVNYGHKLLAETQQKGLRQGVMADLHFLTGWRQYCLSLDNTEKIDFSAGWNPNQPAFYRYEFELEELEDTYLDMAEFGKGVAFINGVNLGRFWNVGPILSLYLPKGFLKKGRNEIIVFETEGIAPEYINLVKQHHYKQMEEI